MAKFQIGDVIDYGFMSGLKVVDITDKYYALQDKFGNTENKFKTLVEKHGTLVKEKIIQTKSSVLYCPKLKDKKEYVDERYNPTEDIFEAIGWKTKEQCERDIKDFDVPEDYEIVKKVTTAKIEEL